jgi:tight adherence protein C
MSTLAGVLAACAVLAAFSAARGLRRSPPPGTVREPAPLGRRAGRRRARRVEHEVPQLLDLLAAGSTAGLSAELSLRRAADALRGPLGEDIRAIARRADLGARWRDELEAYSVRTGSLDLRRTVAVLQRTERLGSSLAVATHELAASVRQARRSASLERARTAPIKMLFPLVFLILPAFLLLTVVPVLLTTVRSIR